MFDASKLLVNENPDMNSATNTSDPRNEVRNGNIVIAINSKQIPLKMTNKSRIRISTESMN